MAIVDCISKFKSVLDIERLEGMAKVHEAKGMSHDTAMVRAASDEMARLASDKKSITDLVSPQKTEVEKASEIEKAQKEAEQSAEKMTHEDFAHNEAKAMAEQRPDMKVTDEDGNVMTAKDSLAKADEDYRNSQKDATLHNVAIQCLLSHGGGV